MELTQLKVELLAVLDSGFRDQASPITYREVERKIENLTDQWDHILKTIKEIRLVIRLFVDESLADDVYKELLTVAEAATQPR